MLKILCGLIPCCLLLVALSVAAVDEQTTNVNTATTVKEEKTESTQSQSMTPFDDDEQRVRSSHAIELPIHKGKIRGERLIIGADTYTVFKGIPYAAPPVGVLRFQRPGESAKWKGIKNCTYYRPRCAQRYWNGNDQRGPILERTAEDCLYLNVFTPNPATNDTYPVIVWIHGGGFQTGSSSDFKQEPILDNFVSRGVIFITLNYRLGPLGFASTGDRVVPGNNGLWDMIQALKWVQRNAHAFQGDPTRVTLMGQGSGAAAASILALSPRAQDLFQRTIFMSGTAISPGSVRNTSIAATRALTDAIKCKPFNSTETLDCLRLAQLNEMLGVAPTYSDDYQMFVPVEDGFGGVIPEPIEKLAKYRRKVPAIIGTTRDESALNLILSSKQEVNITVLTSADAESLVEHLTSDYAGFTNHGLITAGCKYEYVDTKTDPTLDDDILKDGVLKMYTHFWYTSPASQLATYYVKSKVKSYLYSFDHVSENLFDEHATWKGAFHGSDLIFLFDQEVRFLQTRRDKNWQTDRMVTELFTKLLTNFAKTGDPTPDEHQEPTPEEKSGPTFNWTVFDMKKLTYLSVTDHPVMRDGYHWRGHVFWNRYARSLDAVDVGNLHKIETLENKLGDYQVATWILLCTSIFFLAILVGLACYCTRKDPDEDEM